ncbi:MAG: 2-oxoacid:acceptor oxidoreductase subunit alpha [Deltaproteobacteria bacterium]|nr:2-oxoacid:acceptor oxidoreductase subunit alpha [Candidatus Anaeroferrophillus wilburensis]MBN2887929.1 2-oxoacid:acceptor oxidoreductase subunit alpha [Deltaproteobacteria bacterium]
MITITIGGEAGQGLVTVGQLLAKSLVRSGYYIVVTQSYMSRVRGGHNTYSIRISDRPIEAPRETINLLVALTEETIAVHRHEVAAAGVMVADQQFVAAADDSRLIGVPFAELAASKYENIAALGVVASLLGLDEQRVGTALESFFGKQKAAVTTANREVLAKAWRWAGRHRAPDCRLPPVQSPAGRLMINGNEAIALGALSAGLKFCAYYPMTPATSICINLIARADAMGVLVEQAEDEIAAVNMAVGASFAGAPAMVATSGGGFALMEEGVSLAAMTETPLVIAVAMRPGPATGLPTRTAQEDLNLVLYAGHGEFPRAVFAPGSVEECFFLTRQAYAMAEQSQGPIFLLTDQFLADSYRSVTPFPVAELESVAPLLERPPAGKDYKRYQLMVSGVSPRLAPGMTDCLVVADSDAHTEDGHLTEDLTAAREQADKRARKMSVLREQVVAPEYAGPSQPKVLLVCWGSSKAAVFEVVEMMNHAGETWAALAFSQVWPLVPEQFCHWLQEAGEVISVEGNAEGQFGRLIQQEAGLTIDRHLGRYDGLPITPDFIIRQFDKLQEAAGRGR